MAVKVAFHPLHEFYVVQGPGFDQLVDLYVLQTSWFISTTNVIVWLAGWLLWQL